MFPRIHLGSGCLRKVANQCGHNNQIPSAQSITIQKHLATTSVINNLQENDLDMLARLFGHDIRVRRF